MRGEKGFVSNQLILGRRLQAIADLVPASCRRLADIGTDHGYIPAALLLRRRLDTAIAADIGREPLERARRTARQYGLESRMDLRLGDGLGVLAPGEADVIVIAGMGGDAIVSILSAALWVRAGPLLLLQPMSKAEALRRYLPEGGFAVEAEALAAERGVVWPMLSVGCGAMPPCTESQAWGGFLLEGDPLWGRYLEEHILRLRKAAAGLERARSPEAGEKRERFLRAAGELAARKEAWELAHRT